MLSLFALQMGTRAKDIHYFGKRFVTEITNA